MTDRPPQLTREDLRQLSAEAILAAREAEQLDDLLAGRNQGESADREIEPPERAQPQLAEEPLPKAAGTSLRIADQQPVVDPPSTS